MSYWDHLTIKSTFAEVDKHVQEAGAKGWQPYSAVVADGVVVVFLTQEMISNPNVSAVKIATKKGTGPYIPGMPPGSTTE